MVLITNAHLTFQSLHQHDVPVLVCGAGPVGLITALKLAHHGIRCMLIERNFETTKWPKMDITNVRSMELLRTLNLTEELKEIGMITCFKHLTRLSNVRSCSAELLVRRDIQYGLG